MSRSQPFNWPWIAFVVVASLLLSRAFACAMPFAALATLAALTLRGREGLALVLAVWLGNQIIGFGFLHYPWDVSTLAWGLAIGLTAVAGWAASTKVGRHMSGIRAIPMALVASYAAYELLLLAATFVLQSGSGAFTAAILVRIFAINGVALALLLVARRLALSAGLAAGDIATLPHL